VKRAIFVAAATAFFFASADVTAQTMDGDQADLESATVNGAWANPAKCNLGNARRMSLAEALRRAESDYGHCVAIPVYVGDRALFATRRKRAHAPSEAWDARNGRIGFYARDSVTQRAQRHPGTRYWAVGNLSECHRQWPNMTVMGYCHGSGGPTPILIVAEMRPTR